MKQALHLNLAQAIKLMLITLLCLPVWSTAVQAQEAEPYAVFADGVLTFKYDAAKPAGAYGMNRILVDDLLLPEWYVVGENVKKVVFDNSFAQARPTNCLGWFLNFANLTIIEGIKNLNTSNVTDMSGMFAACSSLTSLDLSNFDTSNVTDLSGMFNGCSSLTSLDLSNFDTSNVTNMEYMFIVCSSLTSLDLSNFDTSKVTDMRYMFSNCSSLKTIYASDKFVTKNVETGNNMFKNCTSLKGAIKYDANKPDHKYANYTTGYFTKKDATAIHQVIDSNNEKAEYYNVQGKRISKMQRGLNIVRRGGKVVKQVSK